jgi:hypothetical protein
MEPLLIEKMQTEEFSKQKLNIDFAFVRTIWSLTAACVGLCVLVKPELLAPSTLYICSYMIADYPFAKLDMQIHHAIFIAFAVYIFSGQISTEYVDFIRPVMYRIEYSTVFLSGTTVALRFMENSKYKSIVKNVGFIGFIITFVKYRIIDFGSEIIFNPYIYTVQVKHESPLSSAFFCVGIIICVVFYALNLYWFCAILKKMYKMCLKNSMYDNYETCEYITQYSMAPALIVSCCVYSTKRCILSIPAAVDIAGLITLTSSSYVYHKYCLQRLRIEGEAFNILSGIGKKVLIYDVECIIFGSACHFFAYTWSLNQYSFAFNVENLITMSVCCVFAATTSTHISSMYILRFNQMTEDRMKMYYYVITPQIIISICVAAVHVIEYPVEHCVVLFVKQVLVYWFMFCCVKIEPFHNLNHVIFHLCGALLHNMLANNIADVITNHTN